MNIRLIKAGKSPYGERDKQPAVEVSIVDTIRSWVREFQSDKARKARLDFRRTNNPEST